MKFTILGQEVELQPTPIQTFPEYKVYRTTTGSTVHLDLDGNPIIYTSYMGYKFGIMHSMNAFVKDLGDRIEIRKHVGGLYDWYNYHIDKKTRRAIAYFKSKFELKKDEVDTSTFRVWTSIDLGEYLFVAGINTGSRLIRKSDDSDVVITDPDGKLVSKIKGVHKFDEKLFAIYSDKGEFHVDGLTLKPISYSRHMNGGVLSYFDRTSVEDGTVWVHKGWRKYLVNQATRSVTDEKLDWLPRIFRYFMRLLSIAVAGGVIYCVFFAIYLMNKIVAMNL